MRPETTTMQKVYLLLRNNQQTGPHSLEELIQLGIKKSDLIWIEGKSAGWYYPFEVEALKPYLSAPAKVQTPAQNTQPVNGDASQKKVFVSLPGNAPKKITPITVKSNADYIEQRADQIRKKVQASIEEQQAIEEQETRQQVANVPVQEIIPVEEVVKETPAPKEEAIVQTVPEVIPTPVYHASDIAIDEVPTYAINRSTEFEKPHATTTPKVKQENGKKVEKNLFSSADPMPVKSETTAFIPKQQKEYVATKKEFAPKREVVEKKQPERKKASGAYQYLAAAIFIFVLAGGGWWFYKSFANKQSQTEIAQQPQTAKQIQQQSNTALNTQSNTTPDGQTSSNDLTTTGTSNDFNVPLQQNTQTNQQNNEAKKTAQKKVDPKKNLIVQNTQPTVKQQEEIVREQPPVVKHDDPVVIEKKSEQTVAQEPEKKEGFFKKIGNLFRKKKKEEATDEQKNDGNDSRPVQQNNGERNSVKRPDAGNNENSSGGESNLSDQVDIKVSTTNNSWMIGVQGLKLTMYNRSSQTVKKAAVDVIYYNERNGVIEKKTVYFNNIPPRKSQAVAAPDHQYADHAGYKILSASGG